MEEFVLGDMAEGWDFTSIYNQLKEKVFITTTNSTPHLYPHLILVTWAGCEIWIELARGVEARLGLLLSIWNFVSSSHNRTSHLMITFPIFQRRSL